MTQQYIVEILGKDKTGQAFKQVQGNAEKSRQSIVNLKNAIIALGTSVVVRSIINTTARFQDLRTSLASVTGSAEEGAEAFRFITDIATKTQFSVEDLSRSFIKLKAAGITPSAEILNVFTNTAAITTDQIGTLEAVTDLFARTVGGGLGLEEIERLGDRGVPVLRILKKELNLTRGQISEFGKTAEGAKKIVDAFAKGIQEEFGDATTNLLKNLNVQFSNLGIAITDAQDILGQGLAPVIADITVSLTDLINANQDLIRDFGEGLGVVLGEVNQGFKNLFDNAELIKNSFILLIALKVGLNITKITTATQGLTKAFVALNAVVAKNPFIIIGGLILTAVAVYGDEIKKLTENTDEAKKIQDEYNEVLGNTVKATEEASESVREYSADMIRELELGKQIAEKNRKQEVLIRKNIELEEKLSTTKGRLKEQNDKLKESILQQIQTNELLIDVIGGEIDKLIEKASLKEEDIETSEKKINVISRETKAILSQVEAEEKLRQIQIANIQKDRELLKKFDPGLTEIESEQNKQIELNKLRNDGLISEQEYLKLREDSYKRSGENLLNVLKEQGLSQRAFEQITQEQKKQIIVGGAKDILGNLATVNKQAFQAYKAYQIAEATINAYKGASNAMATYPPPFNFLMAGVSLAQGLAQVSAIRSQQYSGRALGGRVQDGSTYMVGEQGPEMFVPNQSGTIVPNKDLGRATTVNVNVYANDTQGFDDLLVKRRSVIVNVINDALNSQGKEALV